MKIPFFDKLRSYLFLKILLILGTALFFTIILVMVSHQLLIVHMVFPVQQRNSVNYAQYIIKSLGTPPDIEKAREIVKNEKIQIRWSGPGSEWSSSKNLIEFQNLDIPAFPEEKGIYAGFNETGLCIDIKKGEWRYLIILHFKKEGIPYVVGVFAFIVLCSITFILTSIYFAMSWLLKPVRILHDAVRQMGEGNIDVEIATNRNDELGKLTHSFNIMSRKVREMLHARERLLQDVSHELRSPLTRARIALEFLEESNTKSSLMDDIHEMETMIIELLETERLKSQYGGLKLENINISNMIQELCSEFKNQEPGIKIVSLAENIFLKIDPKRIQILLRNLLDNALRYSRIGDYPVEISLREKANEITISIQDFGSGIPEQDLPYIFEPFYRVDKSRSKKTGGYGLGLSLCKRIMEAHQGDIEISSKPNIGTMVFLKFKNTGTSSNSIKK